MDKDHCLICDSDLSNQNGPIDVPAEELETSRLRLKESGAEVLQARLSLQQAEGEYKVRVEEIAELNSSITERSDRIQILIQRLPPNESELYKQRSGITLLRAKVHELRQEAEAKRILFDGFVEERKREIVQFSERIKEHFHRYAQGFLLESCQLIWSPVKDRLGETGEPISFPAFELDMSGSDFKSPVRRSGPDQVSESQREFIDLAFRMALMAVAGGGSTTLVIDAPESSLDAVFGKRAGDVLARFAAGNNRLVVTSNIVEGDLIPSLVSASRRAPSAKPQLVDLFSIAYPTAAVTQLRGEYDAVRKALLEPGGSN